MRLLVSFIMLFLNILQDQHQYSEVTAGSVDLSGDNITSSTGPGSLSSTVEEEEEEESCDCSCGTKEERSLTVGGGLGLAAGTAILIFAFSNTVIISATLVITYILYHILITVVKVLAPGLAAVMAKFLAVFSF